MIFTVRPNSDVPIYRQLVRQVREAIVAGRLRPGDRLPSLREVASELVINHLTVKQAYGILERDGLIESRRGRGTFVADGAGDGLRDELHGDLHGRMVELAERAQRSGMGRAAFRKLASEAWEDIEVRR